jgi:hypothetical protein
MEPISLIITALTAGAVAAAKDTAEKGVKDAYDGLKALIKKRFADKGKADDSNIIDKHEKKPDSKGVKALLEEELIDVEVDKDPEILKVAEELMVSQSYFCELIKFRKIFSAKY